MADRPATIALRRRSKRLAHLLDDVLRPGQRRDRCALRDVRDVAREVRLQVRSGLGDVLGRHHPPEAPTGHRVALCDAVHEYHPRRVHVLGDRPRPALRRRRGSGRSRRTRPRAPRLPPTRRVPRPAPASTRLRSGWTATRRAAPSRARGESCLRAGRWSPGTLVGAREHLDRNAAGELDGPRGTWSRTASGPAPRRPGRAGEAQRLVDGLLAAGWSPRSGPGSPRSRCRAASSSTIASRSSGQAGRRGG